jgi:hypothetical protein
LRTTDLGISFILCCKGYLSGSCIIILYTHFIFAFRYFGDDNKESKDSDEKAKLALLLSKIEERRKQREAVQKRKPSSESFDSEYHISKNTDDAVTSIKSNKRKEDARNEMRQSNIFPPHGNAAVENEAVDVSGKEDTVQKKKKKKHKRKWKEINGSEEGEDNTGENKEIKTVEKMEGFTIIGTENFKKKQKVRLNWTHILWKMRDKYQLPSNHFNISKEKYVSWLYVNLYSFLCQNLGIYTIYFLIMICPFLLLNLVYIWIINSPFLHWSFSKHTDPLCNICKNSSVHNVQCTVWCGITVPSISDTFNIEPIIISVYPPT